MYVNYFFFSIFFFYFCCYLRIISKLIFYCRKYADINEMSLIFTRGNELIFVCSTVTLFNNNVIIIRYMENKKRWRPTLPHRFQYSTIGAEGLNFCVRDGNKCCPFAIATVSLYILKVLFSQSYIPCRRNRKLQEMCSSRFRGSWKNSWYTWCKKI